MLLCVPNVYNASGHHLRQIMFDEMHAVPHRGHRGLTATKHVMRVRFHWTNMMKDVTAMHKACHECQVSKIDRQKPQGQLQPVETPLQIAQSYEYYARVPIVTMTTTNMHVCFVQERTGSHSGNEYSRRMLLQAVCPPEAHRTAWKTPINGLLE